MVDEDSERFQPYDAAWNRIWADASGSLAVAVLIASVRERWTCEPGSKRACRSPDETAPAQPLLLKLVPQTIIRIVHCRSPWTCARTRQERTSPESLGQRSEYNRRKTIGKAHGIDLGNRGNGGNFAPTIRDCQVPEPLMPEPLNDGPWKSETKQSVSQGTRQTITNALRSCSLVSLNSGICAAIAPKFKTLPPPRSPSRLTHFPQNVIKLRFGLPWRPVLQAPRRRYRGVTRTGAWRVHPIEGPNHVGTTLGPLAGGMRENSIVGLRRKAPSRRSVLET